MKSYFSKKIKEYLDSLLYLRGYSVNTIKTYKLNLEEALNYISIELDDQMYEINLMPYRTYMIGKHKKTIYKKLSIFRSFINFLKDSGESIILKNADFIKVPKTLPKPVVTSHIQEALDLCDSDDKLMLLLFYTLGLRISELSNLKIKDIKFGWVKINGKGDKIRDIPLLKDVEIELELFKSKFNPIVYIFEKNNKKLSENQLRYKLMKVFKKVGIKATPHQLRHSFASDMLNSGARIGDVSELLGHSSLETTQIYTKLSSSLKLQNYNDAHPMCKEKDESV
jgi:integrase/recombinase XerC